MICLTIPLREPSTRPPGPRALAVRRPDRPAPAPGLDAAGRAHPGRAGPSLDGACHAPDRRHGRGLPPGVPSTQPRSDPELVRVLPAGGRAAAVLPAGGGEDPPLGLRDPPPPVRALRAAGGAARGRVPGLPGLPVHLQLPAQHGVLQLLLQPGGVPLRRGFLAEAPGPPRSEPDGRARAAGSLDLLLPPGDARRPRGHAPDAGLVAGVRRVSPRRGPALPGDARLSDRGVRAGRDPPCRLPAEPDGRPRSPT